MQQDHLLLNKLPHCSLASIKLIFFTGGVKETSRQFALLLSADRLNISREIFHLLWGIWKLVCICDFVINLLSCTHLAIYPMYNLIRYIISSVISHLNFSHHINHFVIRHAYFICNILNFTMILLHILLHILFNTYITHFSLCHVNLIGYITHL